MPKEKAGKMATTLWIDKTVVRKLDKLAQKGGLTRSKLMANLIFFPIADHIRENTP